ncbi:MAG: FecR domain-containing protein [Armatimonadota bacterium]
MPYPRVPRGDVGRAHHHAKRHGFTLSELLIVIAIIIVLAGIALPIVSGSIQATRKTECASNLTLVVTKLGEYAVEHREYPRSISDLYPEYITHRNVLRCPNDPIKGRTTYDLFYAQRFPNESDEAIVMGCAFHPRSRAWVLRKGGEMEYVRVQTAQLHGDAEVRSRDAAEWVAGDGLTLRPGDAVRTRYGCLIQFEDGTVLTLGENTEVLIAMLAASGDGGGVTVVGMFEGSLLAQVAKLMTRQSTFEVCTPSAVTGVRGTVFRVQVDPAGATIVDVYEGAVDVQAWSGEKVRVKAGHKKRVRARR